MSFRARESMLLADTDWTRSKELHHQVLGLPNQAMAFLAQILAGVSVGLTALAEAAGRGQIEIGADKLPHVSPIRPLDEEVGPRKTGEAVFKHIGSVQLPDLLLEVDTATHVSEALLARSPSSSNEMLAAHGALLAHGTGLDAKGVGSMIPGIDAVHISTAMRAVELSARLRRANERVLEFQNALPIAALWGDGTKGSADMMALDASRYLWTARVDPRRRTYAAGLCTHVRDRWGLFYGQPIVLNERQAGVAVAGVEQHNRAEDRIRISLLAVDTHGVTNVAMAIAKLLGFDLCPRLRDLRERKLFVPGGWPVPQSLEGVTVRRVSGKAIERGGTAWCVWRRRSVPARCLPRIASTGWGRQLWATRCPALQNTLSDCFERCFCATPWPSRTIGARSTRCSAGASRSTSCSGPFIAARWLLNVAAGAKRWWPSPAPTRC